MKINQAFLHGFMGGLSGESKLTSPLTITGDENSITLTKGEGFDEWMADMTPIRDDEAPGGMNTFAGMNVQMLKRIVVAWLHGEEFNP